MTPIGLIAHFEIAGLFCEHDVLGQSIVAQRDAAQYKIDIPSLSKAFQFTFFKVGTAHDPRDYNPVQLIERSESLCEVRVLRVTVVAREDIELPSDSSDDLDLSATSRRLTRVAKTAVVDLCDWIRIEFPESMRIEPPEMYPQQVSAALLYDARTGKPFPMTASPQIPVNVLGRDALLTRDALSTVSDKMSSPGSPTSSDRLLLHAKYLCRETADAHSSDRAIVLAVIAAEIEIKAALARLATEDQLPLVKHLIDSPRDWSVSLHSLFKKLLITLLGTEPDEHRSLARELQKAIEHRNSVVHQGKSFDSTTASHDVFTIEQVMCFLRAMEPA